MRGTPWPRLRLIAAAFVALVFVALHLAGWRPHTSILSGTTPAAAADVARGLSYAVFWFSFVLLAPVLTLLAALQLLGYRLWRAYGPAHRQRRNP